MAENKLSLQNRVPEIIISYWIIKIASTTLGETGADHFSKTLHLGYATTSLIFLFLLGIFLTRKLYIKKFTPILYWTVFSLTSLAGTAICDFMDRSLGLGYAMGSFLLFMSLISVLFFWYRSQGTLKVEHISTDKAEIYYWSAFLISNTLGTAIGDYLADDLKMGFAGGTLIIGGFLVAIVLLHYYTKVSSILLFWAAFVLTRPFGATFGDFLTKPIDEGGANLGTIGSSLVFVIILIFFVYREHRFHRARLGLKV